MNALYYQQIQVIMAILGFYDGKCDGAWGPKSIEAMRKWEMTDSFDPCLPQNGKPFMGRGKLPEGIMYGNKGLISEHLVSEKGLELLKTPLLCCDDVAKACGEHKQVVEKKPEYVHVEEKKPAPVVTTEVDHTASAPEQDVKAPETAKADSWVNKKK